MIEEYSGERIETKPRKQILEIGPKDHPAFMPDRLDNNDFVESHYIALDQFLTEASKSKAIGESYGLESSAVNGDVMFLPFRDESIDEIILYDVLNQKFDFRVTTLEEESAKSQISLAEIYFNSLDDAFTEIFRVLKKGGKLVIGESRANFDPSHKMVYDHFMEMVKQGKAWSQVNENEKLDYKGAPKSKILELVKS